MIRTMQASDVDSVAQIEFRHTHGQDSNLLNLWILNSDWVK